MSKSDNDPDMEKAAHKVMLKDLVLGTDVWQIEVNAGGVYFPVTAGKDGEEVMWVELDYKGSDTCTTDLFDLPINTIGKLFYEWKIILDDSGSARDALEEMDGNNEPMLTVMADSGPASWVDIDEHLMEQFYKAITHHQFLWYVLRVKEERVKLINNVLKSTDD